MNYKVFGNGLVEVVIELGLGSIISEWMPLINELSKRKNVLVYERAGINSKELVSKARTPRNIASELYDLLSSIPHSEKLTILSHSQGCLYSFFFTAMYPEMVKEVIMLDPLSIKDNLFKENLTPMEYMRSGVDKSNNFRIMLKLAKFKLGWLTKTMLKKAPPFYYYNGFSKEEKRDILNSFTIKNSLSTCIAEYEEAHKEENLFVDLPAKLPCKLILVTHSKELSITENMQFGNNTLEFATKVEEMWQDIMQDYENYFEEYEEVTASNSTHYIHLLDIDLVVELIK